MDTSGVYQLKSGNWGFRYGVVVNGKTVWKKYSKDASGNLLKTKKQAISARRIALAGEKTRPQTHSPTKPVTVNDLWSEYCEKGRIGKAYNTIRKQDSLWKNHIQERFGSRYITDISVAEVNDYLSELYYLEGRAYRYVEAFLKMFYLIFGQAYSRGYLDLDAYSKLCLNKGTRIHMPKMKVDEELDIIAFSREELLKLDDYFRGTNAETAYLLGRYCGLRINECYGLKWDHVDTENGTILIDRQMQYQNGLIKLVQLKTRNARREVYMNHALRSHFEQLKKQREQDKVNSPSLWEQNQTWITDVDGALISSTELVHTRANGTIQTVNSMKYHSRVIKEQLGIPFKYHYLRHTYGTMLADLNVPSHILRNQMGHSSINVTMRYYIANSADGVKMLREDIDRL